jgi:gamma-glutamylcyclotransferase (GGCT)/AIG2-like uncharacterized protein YtfP
MTICYFAYGSNMNPARMQARGLAFVRAEAASLSGYQLVFNKRSHSKPDVAYANIQHRSNARVEGVLYTLESTTAVAAMDRFEGTPVRYSRECVAVNTVSGEKSAWIYLANPAVIDNTLLPESNYLAHLLAAEAYLTAPYLALLRAQPCILSVNPCGDDGLLFNV